MMGVQLGGSLAGKLSSELASTSSEGSSTTRSSRGCLVEIKRRAVILRKPAIRNSSPPNRHCKAKDLLARNDIRQTPTGEPPSAGPAVILEQNR
jgi:hypothetical protein